MKQIIAVLTLAAALAVPAVSAAAVLIRPVAISLPTRFTLSAPPIPIVTLSALPSPIAAHDILLQSARMVVPAALPAQAVTMSGIGSALVPMAQAWRRPDSGISALSVRGAAASAPEDSPARFGAFFDGSARSEAPPLNLDTLSPRAIALHRNFERWLAYDDFASLRFSRHFSNFQAVNFTKRELSVVWKANAGRTLNRIKPLVDESIKLALGGDYAMVARNLYVPTRLLEDFGAQARVGERRELESLRNTLHELYELSLEMSRAKGDKVKSLAEKILTR